MNFEAKLPEMAEGIKQLMTRLNYNVSDKGLPKLIVAGKDIFGDLNITAAYAPTVHTIFLNETKPAADSDLLEMIAHELVHAYQDMSDIVDQDQVCIDPSLDTYWEQEYERQAYTVCGTWMIIKEATEIADQETIQKFEDSIENNPTDLTKRWVGIYRDAFKAQNSLV